MDKDFIGSSGDNVMDSTACLEYCEIPMNVNRDSVAMTQHDSDSSDKSEIRVEKILSVRRQLGEGRYYVAEKLDVVVDRILEELLQHS